MFPHFPGNRAKVGHNHDKRKAVSATLSFLKWTGAIFPPQKLESERAESFAVSISLPRKGHQDLRLECAGTVKYLRKFREIEPKFGQNYDKRVTPVSATLSILK